MEEAQAYLRAILPGALSEDIGDADLTTEALSAHLSRVQAHLIYRSGGIIAGIFCIGEVLQAAGRFLGCGEPHVLNARAGEGEAVEPGGVVAVIEAPAGLLLPAERLLLNFMSRLSGIATLTARFVQAVRGTRARIYDTRKTTPLLRALERYAVRLGGGYNHRHGLYDQVLIKDNHLRLAGISIEAAIKAAAEYLKRRGVRAPVETEVEGLDALRSALQAGADIVLLDNMPLEALRQAVAIRNSIAPRALLEASGGVTLENVRSIAESGVERISVGALTHSVPAADLALEFVA